MSPSNPTTLGLSSIRIERGFWAERQRVNRTVTLPIESALMEKTGRFDALLQRWTEGQPNKPHIFWDSDVAKWIEAVAYSIATHPDDALRARAEEMIDRYAKAQQPDGYLNTYYSVVEPHNRWSNLRDCHELYCAGHLMEAAVAWFEATGERTFLDVMERYAAHIAATFGTQPGQKRGYPGHEEIELGLIRLARTTGNTAWRDLAAYFINERGVEPNYFVREAGLVDTPANRARFLNLQAHKPVREQEKAEGHAVRAAYLYAGMADVALESDDAGLREACRRLWRNIVDRRMYITGGIGSSGHGERFTSDYDLPNETAYAETCAAIALVFFAHRMLRMDLDAEYADVMEQALHNGVASGVSLSGDRFFYANPLSVQREFREGFAEKHARMDADRQEWFGCSCCPPNIARLYASLGSYYASISERFLALHLYAESTITATLGGSAVTLRIETDYPWDGTIAMTLQTDCPAEWTLALRIPGWCADVATIRVNGEAADLAPIMEKGYAHIRRVWQPGDRVELLLPMEPVLVAAHPNVIENRGRVAIQRGPFVYCLESCDQTVALADMTIKSNAPLSARHCPDLLGGCTVVEGTALVPQEKNGGHSCFGERLYRPFVPHTREVPFRAVPYALWNNRGTGDMRVWMPVA